MPHKNKPRKSKQNPNHNHNHLAPAESNLDPPPTHKTTTKTTQSASRKLALQETFLGPPWPSFSPWTNKSRIMNPFNLSTTTAQDFSNELDKSPDEVVHIVGPPIFLVLYEVLQHMEGNLMYILDHQDVVYEHLHLYGHIHPAFSVVW